MSASAISANLMSSLSGEGSTILLDEDATFLQIFFWSYRASFTKSSPAKAATTAQHRCHGVGCGHAIIMKPNRRTRAFSRDFPNPSTTTGCNERGTDLTLAAPQFIVQDGKLGFAFAALVPSDQLPELNGVELYAAKMVSVAKTHGSTEYPFPQTDPNRRKTHSH